ncbi:MAG: hypothetical protein QM535_14990 [Limnohabitans sp.]|nr:hypothetical protein [Limnohabitans sp.]
MNSLLSKILDENEFNLSQSYLNSNNQISDTIQPQTQQSILLSSPIQQTSQNENIVSNIDKNIGLSSKNIHDPNTSLVDLNELRQFIQESNRLSNSMDYIETNITNGINQNNSEAVDQINYNIVVGNNDDRYSKDMIKSMNQDVQLEEIQYENFQDPKSKKDFSNEIGEDEQMKFNIRKRRFTEMIKKPQPPDDENYKTNTKAASESNYSSELINNNILDLKKPISPLFESNKKNNFFQKYPHRQSQLMLLKGAIANNMFILNRCFKNDCFQSSENSILSCVDFDSIINQIAQVTDEEEFQSQVNVIKMQFKVSLLIVKNELDTLTTTFVKTMSNVISEIIDDNKEILENTLYVKTSYLPNIFKHIHAYLMDMDIKYEEENDDPKIKDIIMGLKLVDIVDIFSWSGNNPNEELERLKTLWEVNKEISTKKMPKKKHLHFAMMYTFLTLLYSGMKYVKAKNIESKIDSLFKEKLKNISEKNNNYALEDNDSNDLSDSDEDTDKCKYNDFNDSKKADNCDDFKKIECHKEDDTETVSSKTSWIMNWFGKNSAYDKNNKSENSNKCDD